MKLGKKTIILIVTIIGLLTIVSVATYSYFSAAQSINNKLQLNVTTPKQSVFSVSDGGNVTLTITRDDVLKNAVVSNTQPITKSASSQLTVSVTGEVGTTCTYNIYYKDTSGLYVYGQVNTSGLDLGYNITGIASEVNFKHLAQTTANQNKVTPLFGGSTSPFNGAKPSITIAAGQTRASKTYTFKLNFYNQNWDQSALAGKTFKGEFYVDDVFCV